MIPYELFVGIRYTRVKRKNHFISFISMVSMLGIMLGVMALITVLSVMNGFEQELRERILGMVSHVSITGGGKPLAAWPSIDARVRTHPQVVGVAPYVEKQGMLVVGQSVSGAVLRGVRPDLEPQVSEVSEKMTKGRLADLTPGKFQIVLGQELADTLQVGLGDKVTVVIPKTLVTPAGITPRLKRFTVVGLFSVGMHEYDSAMALMHLQDAQKLFRLRDQVSGVRLKLTDLYLARSVSQELYKVLPEGAYPNDWTWQHANFFRALKIEKRMMFLIVALIIAVAAFNIVSSLVMVVTDKKSDIAILKTLGASPASIMGIFVVQGIVIGLVGTVIGVILGVALSLNIETLVPMLENWLDMEFLPGDVYYISTFPSDMHWQDVWQVGSLAFVLTLLATLYPAWRAANTQPAEALRYE